MSEDEFTKLFKYMQTEFKKIDSRFDAVDIRIDHLTNAVDAYAKQSETYMQEMLALGHKVDRLEQWILKVAEATGVKLSA
jgi:3-dehydroquinate dehydratase